MRKYSTTPARAPRRCNSGLEERERNPRHRSTEHVAEESGLGTPFLGWLGILFVLLNLVCQEHSIAIAIKNPWPFVGLSCTFGKPAASCIQPISLRYRPTLYRDFHLDFENTPLAASRCIRRATSLVVLLRDHLEAPAVRLNSSVKSC